MKALIPAGNFENLVFEFRGVKVMIDVDLAALYGTETKKLKQQVKRNMLRFPADFMFVLTSVEKKKLISLAPRLAHLKHSSVNPMAFTEQGVAMLSSVLTGGRAISINIGIMRAFSRYRALLLENKDLKKEILELDAKLNHAFKFLLGKIDALSPKIKARKKIGFNVKRKNK